MQPGQLSWKLLDFWKPECVWPSTARPAAPVFQVITARSDQPVRSDGLYPPDGLYPQIAFRFQLGRRFRNLFLAFD